MNQAFNIDCLDALKEFPDKHFDLCIADPPYGLNITGHHGSQSVQVEREREREKDAHRSSAERDRSVVKVARVYGANTKALSSQRFTRCSMIAQHRTPKHLLRCCV